jgi:hypothetical protein
MEFDRPMPGGGKQCVGERAAPVRLQQRSGQPKRLEAGKKMAHLGQISRPEDIVGRRAEPVV